MCKRFLANFLLYLASGFFPVFGSILPFIMTVPQLLQQPRIVILLFASFTNSIFDIVTVDLQTAQKLTE